MNRQLNAAAYRYGLAVVVTLVATGVRWLLEPYVGGQVPFVTYFPAVFITALLAGFRPTLLTVVLCALIAMFFIMPPSRSFFPQQSSDWMALGLFTFFGVGVAFFSKVVRRKSEQIQREWERYSVTLSSVGDGVIVADQEGRVMFLNPVAEALTGWTLAEAHKKPLETVFQIVNEKTRQPVENPALRAIRDGEIVGLANQTVLIARDGTERAIDDSAAPLRDQNRRVIGVVLVFRDVTLKRAAHLESGRLAALVNSSEDAILGLTLEGLITDWNAGAERLFGYSTEHAVGQSIFSLIVPPDRHQELKDVLARIEDGRMGQDYETLRQHKDGRRIPVSIHISPILDAEGDVVAPPPSTATSRRSGRPSGGGTRGWP